MSQLRIEEAVPPEVVAAREWDEYLVRFGPSAYVAARYMRTTVPPPLRLDREDERDRPRS